MKKFFVKSENLERFQSFLPGKFTFTPEGEYIIIRAKNFLLRCSGLFIDTSDYNPNKYFLHCILDNGGCLLCTDIDSTQNYLVRNLYHCFSVYYNESMIKSGLVAVLMKKWMICPIFGDLSKKAVLIDFFLDVRNNKELYGDWGEDEMRLQISSRNILLYNGATGRILEKVLFNPGLAAITKRLWSVENKIILTKRGIKYGYVLVEINQRNVMETFREDIPRVVFVVEDFGEEFSSMAFFHDANSMFEIMSNKFNDIVCFAGDKKFFVLIRDFLSPSYLIESVIDVIKLHQMALSTNLN